MNGAFDIQRAAMVAEQLRGRGITDARLLAAMAKVPRHAFVPPAWRDRAYGDRPLPIGQHQTISQPFVVALMLEALNLSGPERVLDVGTGSGYAAAVLAELAAEVVTVERRPGLAAEARRVLVSLGYDRVEVVVGDGSLGHAARAPYDAIVVAAAAPEVPRPLIDQLTPDGRLVLPVGSREWQSLCCVTRGADGRPCERSLGEVRFVPLLGACAWAG
ncbi:MAG: protein-L-isoaspartate(D-aspartate) O-methyltransferase [Pseudomonadota bacterium]